MAKELVRTAINLKSKTYQRVLQHGEEIGSHALTETIRDLLNKGLMFQARFRGNNLNK